MGLVKIWEIKTVGLWDPKPQELKGAVDKMYVYVERLGVKNKRDRKKSGIDKCPRILKGVTKIAGS